MLQLVWVVPVLRRPSTRALRWGAVGNLAVLAIWAASRTTGLPIGPHPWETEPVGLLDLACGAYEIAIVAGCFWLVRTRLAPADGAATVVVRLTPDPAALSASA